MEDSVLIAGTALMFLFGRFLMKRLDRFLDENHAHVEIVIYDSEQISFPDNKSNWAQ